VTGNRCAGILFDGVGHFVLNRGVIGPLQKLKKIAVVHAPGPSFGPIRLSVRVGAREALKMRGIVDPSVKGVDLGQASN
jgi:hypothetical protein